MSEQLKNAADAVKNLKSVMGEFQNLDKVTQWTKDILPRDQFTGEIDGHKVQISIGVSGTAITVQFNDQIKAASLYEQMKRGEITFNKK